MLISIRSDLCNYDLYCKFYLNLYAQVILDMLHRLGLLVPDRLSVSRAISVKSDPMGPIGLLVKFDGLFS
jgi:hypothetical protein